MEVQMETKALASRADLTPRQDSFCRLYAETGIALDAYEAAYACPTSSRATIRVNAYRLLRNPKVAQRVRELQDAASATSVRSTASLIRDLEDIVDADVNMLMQLQVGACRHCHGAGGAYQWKDALEYATALVAHYESKGAVAMPSDAGGFGYRLDAEANPACNTCAGAGIPRAVFNSTADAPRGARRLLKGIELHADGSVKRVVLHDQMAARIELHRLRGLHVERSLNLNLNANVPAMPKSMSVEQAMELLAKLAPVPADADDTPEDAEIVSVQP
jgi:hypothetical protein